MKRSPTDAAARSIPASRAIEGETVPVYYRGRKVGEYVRFNDRLLIAALLASSSAARAAAGSLRNDTLAFTGPGR